MRIVAFVLTLFIFTGCVNTPKPQKKVVYVYKRFTMSGWWKLVSIKGENIDKNIKIFLNEKDKSFYGNDSCNNILGVLKKSNKNDLVFGSIASTMMACEDMKTPMRYVKMLEQVQHYKVDDPYLYMYDNDKKGLLVFKKSKRKN